MATTSVQTVLYIAAIVAGTIAATVASTAAASNAAGLLLPSWLSRALGSVVSHLANRNQIRIGETDRSY